ncbi:MAG: hypothetical protein M0C28_40010 [Candidatus Moduliflexus flocculans]|nr:hypothetical protein [Candidatus Moduliflexus flocculans]
MPGLDDGRDGPDRAARGARPPGIGLRRVPEGRAVRAPKLDPHGPRHVPAVGRSRARLTLDGPWQVEFPEGRGAPRTATFERLHGLDRGRATQGSGPSRGSRRIGRRSNCRPPWPRSRRLFLQLGDLAEIAEVTVNGKDLRGGLAAALSDRDLRRRSRRIEPAGDPGRQSLGQPAECRFVEARIEPFHPKQPRPDPDGPDVGQLLRPGPRGKTRPVYTRYRR